METTPAAGDIVALSTQSEASDAPSDFVGVVLSTNSTDQVAVLESTTNPLHLLTADVERLRSNVVQVPSFMVGALDLNPSDPTVSFIRADGYLVIDVPIVVLQAAPLVVWAFKWTNWVMAPHVEYTPEMEEVISDEVIAKAWGVFSTENESDEPVSEPVIEPGWGPQIVYFSPNRVEVRNNNGETLATFDDGIAAAHWIEANS